MKCPACDRTLKEIEVAGVLVDVCQGGCGGVWFDRLELQKFDEAHESEGESLLEIERDEDIVLDRSKRRDCPRCGDVVMMRHFASVKREIEVDECPRCAGLWLDQGELGGYREQYDTEQERNEAKREHINQVLGRELSAMGAESKERLEKAQKIAGVFRWLCPSYWIPGKQDWGAF